MRGPAGAAKQDPFPRQGSHRGFIAGQLSPLGVKG